MNNNSNSNINKYLKEFIIVMRGPSSVVFLEGENFLWESVPTKFGTVQVRYTSRWLKKSDSLTIPGHLWIEIRGFGPSLEEVIEPFANAGLQGISLMALTANAAIGEMEVEIAFDCTADSETRDYFQAYVPPETGILHSARLIDMRSTLSLLEAVQRHTESERLLRAINQYHLALNSWKLGNSIIALAHLWMAIEALTVVKLRAELNARGLKNDGDLADSFGVDKDEDKKTRMNKLFATIRKDLILKGDSECYNKAKEASDGFEHGFMGFDMIRNHAKEIRHRLAGYVRLAIFELSGLDDLAKTSLLSVPFEKPMGNLPIVKYLRGTLIGKGNKLAAIGNTYPFIRWRSDIKNFKVVDGNFNVELNEIFTAELAEGIGFQQKSIEVWKQG